MNIIKTVFKHRCFPNTNKILGFEVKKYVNGKYIGYIFKDFDFNKFQCCNYLGKIRFFKTRKGAEKWVENSFINKKTISISDYFKEGGING